MKSSRNKFFIKAVTLIEVLVVVSVIFILVLFLFPGYRGHYTKASTVTCVNNLKQVSLAFRIYAGDNNERYPTNISTNEKPVVDETTPVVNYFKVTQNELGTPRVLLCPADKKRHAASDFANLSNSNLSYFVGLDADETLPQSMVSGDRNITNDFPPRNGILDLTTDQIFGFTDEMHRKQGNIALGDGSVQQVSRARLRSEIISYTGFATNRIKLP